MTSNTGAHALAERDLVLITHANPEDNLFARWLAARLSAAGYRVWVDLRSLRGGEDFWVTIEQKLRTEARKQIVLVSRHVRKPGVLKELALGDAVGRELQDKDFLIPIVVDDVRHSQFPPELLRRNALAGYPNWADCLAPLLETLADARVARQSTPSTDMLPEIVTAQEHGRLAVVAREEKLLSNWFPVTAAPKGMYLFGPQASRDQFEAWLGQVEAPHAVFLGLAATFRDRDGFAASAPDAPTLQQRFYIPFEDLCRGRDIDPFPNRSVARNHLVSLFRQHWDETLRRRGLLPFEFASGQLGWFFPDGLIEGRVKAKTPDGRPIERLLSGRFKDRRWHLCLVAQPRAWPEPMFRVHANMVLTTDGRTALPGATTQRLRKRLTRSWFNDKWRDLLLASMHWLADGEETFDLGDGEARLRIAAHPLALPIAVSYEAGEARPSEEDSQGAIELNEDFDSSFDQDLEGEDGDES